MQDMALIEQQLGEDKSQRPYINTPIVSFHPVHHLRALIALSPEVIRLQIPLSHLCQTEIKQTSPSRGDQDVGGLDVAMHKAHTVHVVEGVGHCVDRAECLLVGDGGDELIEWNSWVEVVDERECLSSGVIEGIFQFNEPDMRMILLFEPLQEAIINRYLLLDTFRRQMLEHLNDHLLSTDHIDALEDLSGRALAQLRQHLVIVHQPPLLRGPSEGEPIPHPAKPAHGIKIKTSQQVGVNIQDAGVKMGKKGKNSLFLILFNWWLLW